MTFNVPTNQLCTSSLAHWQDINFVDGDMDEKKRNRRAGEKGRGSVVLETLKRKRDGLMNEGKKLQNVGQWQQETVASEQFSPFLCLNCIYEAVCMSECQPKGPCVHVRDGWVIL